MNSLFDIAIKISTPLMLLGLVVLVFYALMRAILQLTKPAASNPYTSAVGMARW
jgi:flagellar biosynthesis protein FliQ